VLGPRDELPVRAMLRASASELRPRAEALALRISGLGGLSATLVESASQPGSGSAPAVTLPTVCVRVTHAKLSAGGLAAALRVARVPSSRACRTRALCADPHAASVRRG
jgi:seryl-tRNA(Sec) selenium transferase